MGEIKCPICDRVITIDKGFCDYCGSILNEELNCTIHQYHEAEGICLICSKPFCSDCGTEVIGKFFCLEHSNYEMLENLVTIYGSNDNSKIIAIKKLLEELNLHPTIINKTEKYFGDLKIFNSINQTDKFNDDISKIIKVLVPCKEVQVAEKAIAINNH